jgi:hypothetical protein
VLKRSRQKLAPTDRDQHKVKSLHRINISLVQLEIITSKSSRLTTAPITVNNDIIVKDV